jgi:hypothetical protein
MLSENGGYRMRIHTKAILLYIAFVGTPLLGLACVLYAGRGLSSPESVSGKWNFDSSEIHAGDGKCEGSPSHPESMEITQTGPRLSAGLGGAEPQLNGYVKRGVAYLHALKDGAPLQSIQADVDPGPGHGMMAGTFRFASCNADIPFHARREPPKRAVEKH